MRKIKTIPPFDDQSPWGRYRLGPLMAAVLRLGQMLPAWAGPLNKVARHPVKYWLDTPVDLRIWGLKLRLSPRGNISEQKLYSAPALFDRAEFAALKQVLGQGGTFADIGANAGIYSLWAHVASQGRARVLGFEPDPEMRRRLAFNLASNGIQSITLLPWALSDADGTARFWINDGQRGTNSLEAPSGPVQRRAVDVQIRTLTGVLAEEGVTRLDAMKIDVEGHEPQVLGHFFAHAPQELWPRLLICEVQHLSDGTRGAFVPQDHYVLAARTGLNAIWRRR